MQEKIIIIFDNPDDFDKLLILIKEQHVQIITTNYSTHELLKNKNIEHKISDEFITDDERKNIQKKSYELSDWYNDSKIKNELIYEHVNLGSLIKSEISELEVISELKFLMSFSVFSSSLDSFETSNKARAYLSDVSVEKDLFMLIFYYLNFSENMKWSYHKSIA